MDEIIGRYRVHTEKTYIVLQHPTGICFDLEPEEALAIAEFITINKDKLSKLERITAPALPAISKRHYSAS
jgi:hypothetical protein